MDHSSTKFARLYGSLRAAIASGGLSAGVRLPASRELALREEVSRGTVVAVFEQLRADGFIESRHGAGTYVRSALEATPPPARSRGKPPPLRPALSVPFPQAERTAPRPFRANLPDVSLFPRRTWARLAGGLWRSADDMLLGDAEPLGYRPLRAALAAYLATTRGVRCDADHVAIVPGAQAGFDLIARATLERGDTVWVEDPGYPGSRAGWLAAGAAIVPMAVDGDGIALPAADAPPPRLISVTPAHQSPLGMTLSLPRRRALIERARHAGAWIVEDDYDGEFRYGARPIAALQGLDTDGRVIHVGSFSKTLLPALRLGYVVLPPRLLEPVRALLSLSLRFAPSLEQATLARFIEGGHFNRHVRRLREIYATRHALLRTESHRLLGKRLVVDDAAAGLDIVGWLPGRSSDVAVARRLAAADIECAALSRYRIRPGGDPGLVLGVAAFDERAIRRAVAGMARVLGSAGVSPAS
ncbi:MAG: PLP-dependent aminotransferase family protein [Alphaproteobacteria bacterium]|nr:PLP-dependent aminotransferase family protein [Alphaproteobacteria bacterium]MCW5743399.1 PLP-dependent aminotransferase family protein [Alphaproteobacteria bacterium]